MATKKKVEAVTEEVKEEVKPAASKAKKATKKDTVKSETKAKKATKVEKAEKVKPAKPTPTEARAIAKNVRTTPRKVRLVIDVIRGKDVKEALGLLKNINKAASSDVYKVVKSAAANATNNFGMEEARLYIAEIYATDGIRMKRYLPRAKGSASGMIKRSANITVVVKMR